MDRTRVIFFAVLAIILLVMGASVGLQWIGEQTALGLFIAATVFSVGVVAMDFLGVLGGHHSGDAAGHLGDSGSHFDGAHFNGASDLSGGDAGGLSPSDDVGTTIDASGAGHDADAAHEADVAHAAGHHAGAAAPVLSVLAYLRLLVYFCLGFGPTGWVGMATGRSALGSLALATPIGILALVVAQAFFRLQRHDTDSQITRQDLQGAQATVIVPLDHKTMGKVRVRVGMGVVDRYALAADASAHFSKGEQVRIVSLTDDCLYVR